MACGPQPREKIPKDGLGPRGVPDCYYTSRVLNSTGRYVKFVKKLRAKEEEDRKGAANTLKELQDTQISDFFIRCDRRSLINNVARRVDLCFASYEQDLAVKRKRLTALLQEEEEENIRKFIVQAQSGTETLWEEKKERLAYLLDKRQKEHQHKYKDTPLSKSSHILGCIYKLRAKEAQEFQLYQMRENQAKKMAEKEFDKMWHTIAMREAEALLQIAKIGEYMDSLEIKRRKQWIKALRRKNWEPTKYSRLCADHFKPGDYAMWNFYTAENAAARMEYDVIERTRRDRECANNAKKEIENKKRLMEKEREMLKQEAILFKQRLDEAAKKKDEVERQRRAKRAETARDIITTLQERQEAKQREKEDQKIINDTWASLSNLNRDDDRRKEEIRARKERDIIECNKYLNSVKLAENDLEKETDKQIEKDAKLQLQIRDKRRCDYLAVQLKNIRENKSALLTQIKDNTEKREKDKQIESLQDEYNRQVHRQIEELVKNREAMDAQERKEYQNKLLAQMEYNNILKERALKEEMEQREKFKAAQRQYDEEVGRMLCRPYFSDEQHPFMKQMMGGLKLKERCPCSKPAYCAAPVKSNLGHKK